MTYFLSLLFFTLFLGLSFQLDCPNWAFAGTDDKHCYDAEDSEWHGWQDAQYYCQDTLTSLSGVTGTGYDLASIPDAFTNNKLIGALRQDNIFVHYWWIGATTTLRQDGNWTWSDGTPWGYSNWAPGQPLSNGSCAMLNTKDGYWYAENCKTWYATVCEWLPSN